MPFMYGSPADAVVIDDDGNIVAQIETKLERKPGLLPADEAAATADWDDLND